MKTPGSAFVYKLKDSKVGKDCPAHYACVHCFDTKKTRSILQPGVDPERLLRCYSCGNTFEMQAGLYG